MIFATGDIHGHHHISKLNSTNWSLGNVLTKNDYLIILGDFGILWKNERDKTEKFWLDWLKDKPWTTLVVDGNHENFLRFYSLPQVEMFGGTVGVIDEGIYHLKRGEFYTIEDNTFFVLGGGLSIDKDERILGLDYWPQELPSWEEFEYALDTLDRNSWTMDYVLTHVPPRNILRQVSKAEGFSWVYNDPVALFLNTVLEEATFTEWFCGHMHRDATFDKVNILFNDIVRIV